MGVRVRKLIQRLFGLSSWKDGTVSTELSKSRRSGSRSKVFSATSTPPPQPSGGGCPAINDPGPSHQKKACAMGGDEMQIPISVLSKDSFLGR